MKKIIYLFLTILLLFTFSSCKKKDFDYSNLDSIVYENILNLNGNYIVVAYQANCENCDNLKDTIYDYYNYTKKNDSAMKIYGININLAINKDICLLSTDTYKTDMLNTTDYQNIKVKSTPSLFVINNHKLVKIISDYNTRKPVTDSKTYLNSLM